MSVYMYIGDSCVWALQMVKAYCGAESTMEAEKGGRFSLFSGNITGEFVELVSKKIY